MEGPEEIKEHPWFENFDWDKLLNRELDAPFKPDVFHYKLFKSKMEKILIQNK